MRPGGQHAQRASKLLANLLALLAIVLATLLAIEKMRPAIGERTVVGYIVIYLLVYEKSNIYCIDIQVNSCIGHEPPLAMTILPTMPTPCNMARCNMAARTRRARTGAKCWHCWLLKTNSQQCQHGDGSRLDAVGIANNANTVRLLHKLSMVAGDQMPEGWGGGPWPRASGNGSFTHKFFLNSFLQNIFIFLFFVTLISTRPRRRRTNVPITATDHSQSRSD